MPASATAGNMKASRDAGLNPPLSFNFAADVLQPRARATPERIAVIGVDRSGAVERWSYERIAQASGRLAGALLEAGIVKGDRILIFMPRTPLWLIAMTACQHIGAIPVPCITQIAAGELAYRARQCGARGAISSAELAGRFAGLEATLPVRIAHGGVPGWRDLQSIADSPRPIPPTAEMAAETPALMYFRRAHQGRRRRWSMPPAASSFAAGSPGSSSTPPATT
jgi:acetyl-CoA synthetase